MSKVIKVGFLGFGNVGYGVWKLLENFKNDILHRDNVQFEVVRILVRDVNKIRHGEFPNSLLTDNPNEVISNPDIDIIMEFMGGENPAFEYLKAALENKKTVITANKVTFALHWPELQNAAQKNGVGLYYEAAVCGAIPIIHTIETSLQANKIDYLYGIVNGTTNYILTRMCKEKSPYSVILKDAQKLGLAEPNPAADVEGLDAAYKLSILASLAFHGRIPFENVYVEGITQISEEDINCAEKLGYTIKLLAIAKRNGLKVETRVHPTLIKTTHPLANVSGSFNAVYLNGHACGEMMFMGHGAGDLPTASALVSDLIRASTTAHAYPTFDNSTHPKIPLEKCDDWQSLFYIRLKVKDQPGILSKVAGTFSNEGVSIQAMQQYEHGDTTTMVTMVIITHLASENAIQQAVKKMNKDYASVETLLRVE